MTRYELKIKQSSNEYLSPWKISYILDNLTSDYYKKIILDQLTEMLEELSITEIPVIFNGSFDLYNKYSKLKNFSIQNSSDVENFYYLGDLVSLRPNIKIKKIELIFKLHRELYTFLNRFDIKMDRSKIIEYITPNFNLKKVIQLDNLSDYVMKLLEKENNKLKQDVSKQIDKTYKEFENFLGDIFKLNLIDEMRETEYEEYLKEPSNKRFINKYYDLYFDTYMRYSRPIIAIFDIEKGNINILGIEFIKESLLEANEEKIEIKEISKNSPTLMDICIGYIGTGFLANTIFLGLSHKKGKLEKLGEKSLEEDEELISQEVINLRKAMQGIEEFTHNNKFDKNIIKIEDFKVRRNLEKVNKNIISETLKNLEKNDFLNSDIKIKSIKKSIDNEENSD